MIQSMTAFANQTIQNNFGTFTFEIRSVNHRYLDVTLRSPEMFRKLEMEIRTCINKSISRGKIDLTLSFQPNTDLVAEMIVNKNVVKELIKAVEDIQQCSSHIAAIDPIRVLQWPGVMKQEEMDLSLVEHGLLEKLKETLDQLVTLRRREGSALKEFILQKIHSAEQEVVKVQQQLPIISQTLREKFNEKLNEAGVKVEPNRYEQEVVFLLQKSDVAEEIERLKTHLNEVRHVLVEGGIIGRRLDFLMQELNRETNTLGAKSTDLTLTSSVVELKVLIEQMREQIQNIE